MILLHKIENLGLPSIKSATWFNINLNKDYNSNTVFYSIYCSTEFNSNTDIEKIDLSDV